MVHLSYMLGRVFSGILGLIILLSFWSQVSAQLLPQGSISSVDPSSCTAFPCSVSLSWNVSNNPDGDPVQLINGGTVLSSSSTGNNQNFTISNASNIILYVGSTQVDSKSIALVVPTATPTPTPTPVPTVPDYRTCNQPCGSSNAQCISGLTCLNGLCRLPSNPNDSSCTPPSANTTSSGVNPTATPTKAPSAGSAGGSSVLGTNITSSVTPIPGEESGSQGEILGTDTINGEVIDLTPTPTPSKGLIEKVTSNPIMAGVFIVGISALGFSVLKLKKFF